MIRGLLCLLAACAFTPPTPQAYVRRGPAFGQIVTPVAALPVECGAATLGCLPGYRLAVASATRIAIEFGGHGLVDSELINAELQRRTSTTQETAWEPPAPGVRAPPEETTTTEVTGRTWIDLPPPAQRELLTAMGIQGLLRAAITMSVPQGMSGLRLVVVSISVSRLSDGHVVWQSQCGVQTGDFHSEPQAIELATRCALESGTLWW